MVTRQQEFVWLRRRANRVLNQELRRHGFTGGGRPLQWETTMRDLYQMEREKAGRKAGLRFAQALRRQGFLTTEHFLKRLEQRAKSAGIRLNADTFRRDFVKARHYRDTRPGRKQRYAVISGLPIVYRTGGWKGERVVLITVYDPFSKLPPARPVPSPLREADSHSGSYQAARQRYLKKLPADRRQPRFITGWLRNELRRRQQHGRRRPVRFRASGRQQTSAKTARLRRVLADPRQPENVKKWARQQLRRLQRGQQRLKKLRAGQRLRKPRVRGVPGFDVGHRIPGLHDERNFRIENAWLNRRRPSVARKVGVSHRYREF